MNRILHTIISILSDSFFVSDAFFTREGKKKNTQIQSDDLIDMVGLSHGIGVCILIQILYIYNILMTIVK